MAGYRSVDAYFLLLKGGEKKERKYVRLGKIQTKGGFP